MTRRVAAGLALVALAAGATTALGAAGETVLVSRQSPADGGAAANGSSRMVALSADGGRVAFQSSADNLSDADVATFDVFVREQATGALSLVSRRSDTSSGQGAGADGASTAPAISANGRFVAFESQADNLAGEIFAKHVFLRDTQMGRTLLISRATGANGQVAGESSARPSVSLNGRYVAFESIAENLDREGKDFVDEYDVWVRDTVAGTTTLASIEDDESRGGDGSSYEPSISADGRYVAFESLAETLSRDDAAEIADVYVRDTLAGRTGLVSRGSTVGRRAGEAGDDDSGAPAISANGRFIAFESGATNLSPADADETGDVFVRDLETETTTLVSRATDGSAGDGHSFDPAISGDGRYVAFTSRAGNLSDVDGPSADVYVRDLVAGTTSLVSRQSTADGGAGADGASGAAAISADGGYVGFDSSANNLSALDIDRFRNAFLRDPLGQLPGGGRLPGLDGSGADTTAPVLSRVALSRRRFRVAPRRRRARGLARAGTIVRFRLSEDARVTFSVGRRKLVWPGAAGANRQRFSGRFRGRPLRRGRYRAKLVAIDQAGNRSAPKRLRFRIVRR